MLGSDLHAGLAAARVVDLRREADARALARELMPRRAVLTALRRDFSGWYRRVAARPSAAPVTPVCC